MNDIPKQKRYVVTVDYYVWADSDDDAITQAKIRAHAQDIAHDDRCSVVSILEQPHGTYGNRHVYGENSSLSQHKPS